MKASIKRLFVLLTFFVGGAGASVSLAGDKEERIPLENVPAIVIAAAENAVEGISLTEAEIEQVKKGKVIYELEGVADGVFYEIEVASDGTVIEVEEDDDHDEEEEIDGDDEAEGDGKNDT